MIIANHGNERLEDNHHGTDHLGYGFELAEHACGNHYTAFAGNDKTEAGYAKLTEKYNKNEESKDYAPHDISERILHEQHCRKYRHL